MTRLRKTLGYRWFDHETGRVDLLALARDAVTGLPLPEPTEVPPWLEARGVSRVVGELAGG